MKKILTTFGALALTSLAMADLHSQLVCASPAHADVINQAAAKFADANKHCCDVKMSKPVVSVAVSNYGAASYKEVASVCVTLTAVPKHDHGPFVATP